MLVAYFVLLSYSPTVIHGVAVGLTESFYVLMIGEGLVWLFMGRGKNGKHITYAERVARFKEIFGSHDYLYFLDSSGSRVGHGSRI